VIDFISDYLDERERLGLRRHLREVASPQGRTVLVGGRELLCFCSNNYLGLANDPALKRAAKEAVDRFGTGSGASRLICGNMPLHRELERAVAELKGTEDAILFSSGYAANVGTIPALVGRGDAVIIDRLNHASLVDGCRLSGAKLLVYPHRDVGKLEHLLQRRDEFRRVLIVTDGVFSMDGDIAPMREIIDLAERFDAMAMIDDAHATGVLGPDGGGTLAQLGINAGRVDVVMGTLSKAVGSIGGFVAGSSQLIGYLRNTARSFIYTTALPPGDCAAALAGLAIIRDQPERRERLWRHTRRIRGALSSAGLDFCGAGFQPANESAAWKGCSTPIIPLIVGDAARAVEVSDGLLERGILVPAIRPPTVPRGSSRLRLTPISTHTDEDVGRLIDATLEMMA